MANEKLFSVQDVANRLGVSRQRVHTLIARAQLSAIRLGRYYYIEEAELERYMALPHGKPYAPRSTAE